MRGPPVVVLLSSSNEKQTLDFFTCTFQNNFSSIKVRLIKTGKYEIINIQFCVVNFNFFGVTTLYRPIFAYCASHKYKQHTLGLLCIDFCYCYSLLLQEPAEYTNWLSSTLGEVFAFLMRREERHSVAHAWFPMGFTAVGQTSADLEHNIIVAPDIQSG